MKLTKFHSVSVLRVGFWLIVIALLGNIARITIPRLKVYARGSVSHARSYPAYTSILKETVYDTQGRTQPGVTNTWAVRADGSHVVRLDLNRNGSRIINRKIYFASGERVSLDEISHMKSTTAYSDGSNIRWIRDPESKCINSVDGQQMAVGELFSGNEVVDGYPTVRIVRDNMTFWYAPNYGCALVKFEAKWKDGSKTEQELVALLPGEPSPALFDIPANFVEVAPSKMLPSEISSDTAQRLDQKYYHVQ